MGFRRAHPVSFRVLSCVVLVVLAFVVTDQSSANTNYNIAFGAGGAIVLIGLSFLTGFSGQVSLGNGAFMGVGGYAAAIWADHQGNSPIVVDLVVATLVGALAGLAVGLPATRLRGPYLAGMTIAVALSFPFLVEQFSTWTNGDQGLTLSQVNAPQWFAHFVGASATSQRALNLWHADLAIVVTAIAFFFMANLFRSRTGRAMRLMRENDVAAELAGVHLARSRVLAFVVSAACAGLGGGLTALVTATVGNSPSFSFALSIQLLTLVVIGGIGTLSGSLVAGILYAYATNWIIDLSNGLGLSQTSNLGSSMNGIIFGGLLIIFVIAAPLGLTGTIRFAISQRARRRGRT